MNDISSTTKLSAERSRSNTDQVTALATLANQLGDSVSRFRLEDGATPTEQAVLKDIDEVSGMMPGASMDEQLAYYEELEERERKEANALANGGNSNGA